MIEMKCPHCGHQLRVRSKYAGKQGQCKHCQGLVDVPNTYAEIAEAEDKGPSDISTVSTEKTASTALADLVADDDPTPVAPTLPMPADAMASLMDEPPPQFHARLSKFYWLLAIIVSPVALVWGIVLPSAHPQKRLAIVAPVLSFACAVAIVGFVLVGLPRIELPVNRDSAGETGTTSTPAAPPAILPNAETTPADAGVAYAQTRLPSYPGLVFGVVDASENELSGPLAQANPAALTTYEGHVAKDFETMTAYFFQELQNRGWTIGDYGYGDETNGETYIIGSKDDVGIVYRTRNADARTRIVITHGPLPESP